MSLSGHGRLNRLRRLGRSMAYHYFHKDTGGVAKGVLRGATLHATLQSQTLQRSFVLGPIDSVLSHRRMQSSRCCIVADEAAILADNGKSSGLRGGHVHVAS